MRRTLIPEPTFGGGDSYAPPLTLLDTVGRVDVVRYGADFISDA
jgi:hypothetical protein